MTDNKETDNKKTHTSKTCGELLVELLAQYQVDTVFGIPGVHTVELYRGLPSTKIQHITPRHEQGAGFMADGYARVSGKVGVCFIITGPGMTNILTAMAQAAADSIPMLVISSVNPTTATGSEEGHLHELDNQQLLVSQVAAFSKTVWQPSDLPKILAQAFAVFSSERPQPVHIQIPIDVITQDASDVAVKTAAPINKPQAPASQIDAAAEILKQAKQPVILYGGGCMDADDHAQKLSEILDAPTFLTINAKGLLPPAHPLSLGSNQSLDAARQLIKAADVVLAIGTELGETDYDVVFNGEFGINGQLIRIDCSAQQLQRAFVADLAILSDASHAITVLYQALKNSSTDRAKNQQGTKRVSEVQKQLVAELPDNYHPANALLRCIRETLADVAIIGDSTHPVYAGNHGYESLATRRWFNSSTGYGTLGYALPAAIGAKIAHPAPVVCLIGDGGIQFTLSELICAAELQLPVIVLIWHNQGYGEIRRYMQDRQLPEIGVDVMAPDFEYIAKAYFADFEKIDSKAQFIQALSDASQKNKATILEVHEDAEFLQEMGASYAYFS